jgi:hypothetical protein
LGGLGWRHKLLLLRLNLGLALGLGLGLALALAPDFSLKVCKSLLVGLPAKCLGEGTPQRGPHFRFGLLTSIETCFSTMAGVHMSDVSLGHIRDGVRKIVPGLASQLARAFMDALPEVVLEEITQKVQASLEAAAIAKVWGEASAAASAAATTYNEPVVALWASEIGSYFGKDSWTSRDEALGRVWERSHVLSYKAARDLWIGRGRKALRYTSKDLADGGGVGAGMGGAAKGGQGTGPSQTQFGAHVKTAEDMTAFLEKASARDTLRLFSAKGKAGEDITADLLASYVKQPLASRNTACLWRSDMPVISKVEREMRPRPPGAIIDPGLYSLTGEVDGWLLKHPYQDVVVEFKTRMKSIPDFIPEKDLFQVQAYLAMHDVNRGLHVQRMFSDATNIVVTEIVRDPNLWEAVIRPGLDQFVRDVRRLMRGSLDDEDLRHKVFSACEPAASLAPAAPIQWPKVPRLPAVTAQTQAQDAGAGSSSGQNLQPKPRPTGPTPPKTMPYKMFKSPTRIARPQVQPVAVPAVSAVPAPPAPDHGDQAVSITPALDGLDAGSGAGTESESDTEVDPDYVPKPQTPSPCKPRGRSSRDKNEDNAQIKRRRVRSTTPAPRVPRVAPKNRPSTVLTRRAAVALGRVQTRGARLAALAARR